MSDVLKTELLLTLGYASHHEIALEVLCEERLTNARKSRISLTKVSAVSEALARHFVRICNRGDCRAHAARLAAGRVMTSALSAEFCDSCGGSAAAPELNEMLAACARAGWRKLCIVGGSPAVREEISHAKIPSLSVRLIDGCRSRTSAKARADIAWADHIVVWGGTQLDHSVSTLYSGSGDCSTVAKRSVQELWRHVAEAANRAASR